MGNVIWRLVLIVGASISIFASAYYASKGDVAATVFMCSMTWWMRAELKEREEADGNG